MENIETIKEALSYSLASDLHEAWRAPRRLDDGTYQPRIKESKDKEWNARHGTNQVDIASLSFEDLPANWQYENLKAANVAINMVFDKVISGATITPAEEDLMASVIHNEWLKRNDWVFDKEYGDPKLTVPFNQLSKEEQDKDRAQLGPAIKKVKAYINDELDISEICENYNITKGKRTR